MLARPDTQITANALVAYHESGHAVCAWLLGYSPLSIKMRDEHTGRGQAEFATRRNRLPPQARGITPDIEAVLDVIISLAGVEAETQLCPEATACNYMSMHARGVMPSDFTDIQKQLAGYAQADIDVVMQVSLFVCRRLILSHWPLVEALAEALLKDGIVRRREMLRILGRRTMSTRDTVLMASWLVAGARLVAANPLALHFSRLPAA